MSLSAARRRKALAWSAAAALLVALLGGWITDIGPWYLALKQPGWKPPDSLFGAIWTLIYACAVIAATYAWERAPEPRQRRTVATLFVLNGTLNLIWSWLFFRQHRPDWALWEVAFLWASVLHLMLYTLRFSRRSGWFLLPYLLWVSAAALLNREVVALNGPFGGP